MQLQGMQAILFVMVATGNYLDTGDGTALLTQLTICLPSIGACCHLPRPQSPAWTHRSQGGAVLSMHPCHHTLLPFPMLLLTILAWCHAVFLQSASVTGGAP